MAAVRVSLAAALLATLAACGTAPTTDPGDEPGPTESAFGTATWNEATWQ